MLLHVICSRACLCKVQMQLGNEETLTYLCNALYAPLRVALLSSLDEPCILCKAAGIQKKRHAVLLAHVRRLHVHSG